MSFNLSSLSITRKSVWISLALLLLLLTLMILSFSYSYRQSLADNQRLQIVSDMSLLSQQLLTSTAITVKSDSVSFEQLEMHRDEFQGKFTELETLQSESRFAVKLDSLDEVRVAWKPFYDQLAIILKHRTAINNTHDFAKTIYEALPSMQLAAEQIVLRLEKQSGNTEQLKLAISQLILLQKLENNLLLMIEGRGNIERVINSFSVQTLKFDDKLNLLLKGDSKKGLAAVSNQEALFYLEEISSKLEELGREIRSLLDSATSLQRIYDSVNAGEVLGEQLFQAVRTMQLQIGKRKRSSQIINISGYVFAAMSLLSLIWLAYALFHDHREQLRKTTEENETNQQGIIHLMNRMTALSQGDLTVSARVTKDITGSIADAFNYTVEELRDLVTKINTTSGQLNDYAQRADRTADELSEASKAQSNEVVSASTTIGTIAKNVEQVATYAVNSAEVAQKSLNISREGAQTVRETLSGMHAIREQVQVTAKRIKRLSESSQEVSHISQLMNEIAEQTQVLALNASIQMSSAGDSGKSFGGVAEEIQLLAKQATNTSRKAEILVNTMQMDTQKTVTSMEETIAHVVKGTQTAEDAGRALVAVESESDRIAKLMMNIARVTKEQLDLSKLTRKKMASIQEITLQAFERVSETSQLINSLTSTANELQVSVYRFKLPELKQLHNNQSVTANKQQSQSGAKHSSAEEPRKMAMKVV